MSAGTARPSISRSDERWLHKVTVRRLGIEAAWFAYKTLALETIARDWLTKNGLLPDQALQAGDQLGRSAPSPARR